MCDQDEAWSDVRFFSKKVMAELCDEKRGRVAEELPTCVQHARAYVIPRTAGTSFHAPAVQINAPERYSRRLFLEFGHALAHRLLAPQVDHAGVVDEAVNDRVRQRPLRYALVPP